MMKPLNWRLLGMVLLLVVLVVASGSSFTPVSGKPVEDLTDEELIAIGKEILTLENGEYPVNAFSICERLEEVDPELAEAALDHMESTAIPIETVLENIPEHLRNSPSNGPVREGVYVRDGDGGHYEFFDSDPTRP